MRGHLPPSGIRIVLGAHRLKKHFKRCNSQREAKRAITIVRVNPVVAGAKNEARGGQNAFMSCSANLEKGFVLAFQLNFAVIDPPLRKRAIAR